MIELGVEARDRVTGVKGIIVARTDWLNGCARYTIQPKAGKDSKAPDNLTVDEQQVEVLGKGLSISKKEEKTGGPIPSPRQKAGPKK